MEQKQADEDEGNAQELSQIERQVALEGDLVFLDKLDQESRGETGDEAGSECRPCARTILDDDPLAELR